MTDIAVIINNRAKNAHRMEDYLSELRAHGIDYQLYKADPQQLEKNIQHCCSKYSLLLIGVETALFGVLLNGAAIRLLFLVCFL
ncbi:hypothetical protein PGH45_04585 [Legionella pneumophila]|nr:hypothetical protein [Legionella pneumophila]